MDEVTKRRVREGARQKANQKFVERLTARRPETKDKQEKLKAEIAPTMALPPAADEGRVEARVMARVFEAIVFEERPVLFVESDWVNKTEVTIIGNEAQELVDGLDQHKHVLQPLIPLVGRIDVTNFPGTDYVGTGWFVAPDVVITNRHVASLIARWDGRKYAFTRGILGKPVTSSVCTAHEFDDLVPDETRVFNVSEVLYIEPQSSAHDIAFLRVKRRTDGSRPDRIPIAAANVGDNVRVLVVGYPARAPRSVIPDQALMKRLYRDRYDVKRAAPGFTMPSSDGSMQHDCTTLGGNSGSVVLDLAKGKAVGLHFAGLYQEANYAVQAQTLRDYVNRKQWNTPRVETDARPFPQPPPAITSSTATMPAPQPCAASGMPPFSITITFGGAPCAPAVTAGYGMAAQVQPATAPVLGAAAVENAAKDFWDQRPAGVVAVRVGFSDDGETIGDVPFIAASVPVDRLAAVQSAGPARFQTLEVKYLPAEAYEILDSLPGLESVDSIQYDDDARTGSGFSFDEVDEEMHVEAHVGPEYSWDVLQKFLGNAKRSLVSAIYEFHGSHIASALEERLDDDVSLRLVMDNATFHEVKKPSEEFDRVDVFERWEQFGDNFARIVAPEGAAGLVANAYHIKVTVRDDSTFWLSSGNWKMGSSQPIITQAQRDDAESVDLPGNREWHVVIKNATLAKRFRNHITQDFKRAKALGGGVVPKSHEAADVLVDVPIEPALERRPPDHILKPKPFTGRRKVKPLLTPDQSGAVYSEAVLELIDSAHDSLWFQIPYISMPSNPRANRGFIDELIKALTVKLKTLPDARLLLRRGGSAYSNPTHAAWYFKSKGVDIAKRVRQIDNHHTKGMIADGQRLLIGSHNWSKPGVTLNRDASLIFDDAEIASYYAEAFDVDWKRASPIKPKKHAPNESPILEAVGAQPPAGYRRVLLSELLKEDD